MNRAETLSAQYGMRDRLLHALQRDLVGPHEEDERLTDAPFSTYIAGVLYPQDSLTIEADQEIDAHDDDDEVAFADPPVAMANARYPSSLGITFAVCAEECESLEIVAEAAQYVDVGGAWQRQQLDLEPVPLDLSGKGASDMRRQVHTHLELFVRVRSVSEGRRAVTAVLLNTARARPGERDALSYFQTHLGVSSRDGAVFVHRGASSGSADADQRSHALLYRNRHTFAVGHGASAEWTESDDPERALDVSTVTIPAREVEIVQSNPSIPSDGLSMKRLGTGSRDEVLEDLQRLVMDYARWIEEIGAASAGLPSDDLRVTAHEHIAACSAARARIESGIAVLRGDDEVWEAFSLMNQAMLQQRARSAWVTAGCPSGGPELTESHKWYPFQIAFILLNLHGVTHGDSADRDIVDLLWFPTGGGKTEAYLGLVAYVILLRRLRFGDRGAGVTVLMRYTLRLLTIQQFERAASLICALEAIRQSRADTLGHKPITIGLWVGRAGTPSTLAEARTALNDIRAGRIPAAGNPMQLHRCPWCGARLTGRNYWIGKNPHRLRISCPSDDCLFHRYLPVYVVDDDIFEDRPALVIATADKFAALPWMREGGYRIFIDPGGQQPPPELIVQDELHLISGPLGTLAGLYETAVDLLCTNGSVRPKVIASTATIRRASDQVRALFDREMAQFPPPGLDAGDSFFATQAPRSEKASRLYVGALAAGSSQSTLMIRSYAALMQAVSDDAAPDAVRDPYWTLVGYFNSLRVLGGARIQVLDDVQDRLAVIAKQQPREAQDMIELTSRESSSDIPSHLERMGVSLPADGALDYVLATNMISVGVDIDRLGLMVVMGQPQATAEYIQATSRVGRRHPGLVLTLYNASRSRDRSHYERFATYHDALYQQVEATSVTPFSPRARDRALHALLILLARVRIPDMRDSGGARRISAHREALDAWVEELASRAERMPAGMGDSVALGRAVRDDCARILDDWSARAAESARFHYVPAWDTPNDPDALMGPAGAAHGDQMPTPSSLRDVDSECGLYLA